MKPEPQAEFYDRVAVPAALQDLIDAWPEIDPVTARMVRTAIMSGDRQQVLQAWELLYARATLAQMLRVNGRP